jgi:uncharacterized membrane protein
MVKEFDRNSRLLFFSKTTEAEQVLILSCMFSAGLIIFRMLYTSSWTFVFLLWNLFLAMVPYLISRTLSRRELLNWPVFIRLLIWLLFIPNSFYILTDLFHLDMSADIPQWYDLLLLLSFAWNGLLLGVLSIRQIERLFERHFNRNYGLIFIYPVMFLNAFGIYIGRYLRFNSWDVVTNPFHLTQDIVYMMVHPVRNRFDWCMVFGYSLFITLIYYSLKHIRKSGRAE